MSRYLTPSKISLLVLVSMYCDSVVPNQAIIPVLSFIVSHLVPTTCPTPDAQASGATINSALSIDELEKLLKPHSSSVPGRNLFDQFLKQMWSIDCLHSLHGIFHNLGAFLRKTPNVDPEEYNPEDVRPPGLVTLSRVSPLGMFLRRAQLEFTRIHFHDAVKLWTAFLKFRAPTEAAWRRRHPSAARTSFDAGLAELGLENGSELLQACYGSLDTNDLDDTELSSEDIEAMLEFQLDRLQSRYLLFKNLVARSLLFQGLEIECQRILRPNFVIS